MPHAVTHFLIPAILLNLFRDIFFKKNKEKFPLHYVLIGGLAGLLPDLDVAMYYILSFFNFSLKEIHRTFSHNIFVPLLFILLGIVFFSFKNKSFGRHHLKLHNIFFVIAFGTFMHLVLDSLLTGNVMFFYPFSLTIYGTNLINYLPLAWKETVIPSLDAALLVFWIIYLELKHKISDFI